MRKKKKKKDTAVSRRASYIFKSIHIHPCIIEKE